MPVPSEGGSKAGTGFECGRRARGTRRIKTVALGEEPASGAAKRWKEVQRFLRIRDILKGLESCRAHLAWSFQLLSEVLASVGPWLILYYHKLVDWDELGSQDCQNLCKTHVDVRHRATQQTKPDLTNSHEGKKSCKAFCHHFLTS